jgi:hypothetical protein
MIQHQTQTMTGTNNRGLTPSVTHWHFAVCLGVLALLVMAGRITPPFCAAHPPATSRAELDVPAQGATSGQSAPSKKSTGAQPALEAADRILQQMSRITGLPVKRTLKKELISKPEMSKYLKDNLSVELPPEELHAQEASLKAFGIVGADFNLEKFLIRFYTEQAAGFYDPRRHTMFMADWVPTDLQKTVLAHELTHALQDQNFDLWKFMHAAHGDDDATAARQAFVEGYATLSMTQASLGPVPVEKVPSLDAMMDQLVNQQMAEFPVFSKAPFFLRFEALFPYVQGMHFARRGLELGGWQRLNQTFSDPPTTTAQIFQPDLYFDPPPDARRADQSEATRLTLPSPPALEGRKDLRQVDANVMGEAGYDALLGQFGSQDEAQKVSAQWRGDRYLVYEGPGQGEYTLVTRTRWANAAAASEFCGDYKAILKKQLAASDGITTAESGGAESLAGEVLLRTAGPRQAFLLHAGDECRWAEGVPEAQADSLEHWLASLP